MSTIYAGTQNVILNRKNIYGFLVCFKIPIALYAANGLCKNVFLTFFDFSRDEKC